MPGVENLSSDFSSIDKPLVLPNNLEIDKPKEKCAIVGVISFNGRDVAEDIAISLRRMHNRGQEGTGVALFDPDSVSDPFKIQKFDGKPTDVWADPETVLEKFGLFGDLGIGQDRYVTSGNGSESKYHQPFVVTYAGRTLALAHNGNIPLGQLAKMRSELPADVIPEADTDSEILALRIASAEGKDWEEKIRKGLTGVVGAYSLTIATDSGELFGIRDPFGIRPLILADTEDGAVIASETNGIDEMITYNRYEVEPGEMVRITREGEKEVKRLFPERDSAHCSIEGVYFAHRNSRREGSTFYEMRYRMGQALASERVAPIDAIIVGVPGSATEIAAGYAEALGRTQQQNLLRIRDKDEVTRSFMMDDEEEREKMLATKFTVSEDARGKYIVIIDDSIIRGGTTKVIIEHFRKAGARRVDAYSASPRFKDICDLGMDIAGPSELVALEAVGDNQFRQRTNKEIAAQIGADDTYFLSLRALLEAQNVKRDQMCTHCLTSEHPFDMDSLDLIKAVTPITLYEPAIK